MNNYFCGIDWGSMAEIITCIVAIIAFLFSIIEYRSHKKRERINILTQFSVRYTSDPNICSVVKYLEQLEDETNNPNIPDIHQIEMYMRFFEEMSCLIKAKSLKENIVYYMFGHYVLIFADNIDKLPKELEYDKGYWILFRNFVKKMRKAKKNLYPYKTDDNKMDEYRIDEKRIKL